MSTRAVVLDDSRELRIYDHGVVIRLARYLRGRESRIALAMVGIVAYTATVVALPWMIKRIVDGYIGAGDTSAVDLATIAFLFVATVQLGANYFHQRIDASIGQELLLDLRTELFGHIHKLSMPFFDRNEVGKVMSRIQNDTEELEDFVSVVVASVADLLSLVGVISAMFIMSPRLAIITLTVVPLVVGFISVWQKVARAPRMRVRTTVASINSHLQETISGIRVVQSMNREQANMRRFGAVAEESLEAFLRMNRTAPPFSPP